MTDIYTQLFNSYIHDVQMHLRGAEKETLESLVQRIPISDEHKIDLTDQLTALRSRCCEESLFLGIAIGLRLSGELRVF